MKKSRRIGFDSKAVTSQVIMGQAQLAFLPIKGSQVVVNPTEGWVEIVDFFKKR
jgi:hypothetical protein